MSAQSSTEDEDFGKLAGSHDKSMTGTEREIVKSGALMGSILTTAGLIMVIFFT